MIEFMCVILRLMLWNGNKDLGLGSTKTVIQVKSSRRERKEDKRVKEQVGIPRFYGWRGEVRSTGRLWRSGRKQEEKSDVCCHES